MTDQQRYILDELSSQFGPIDETYSGRGLFGAKCVGIVTDEPDELIEEAAANGIRNAKRDAMGRQTIVYWPSLTTEPGPTSQLLRDEVAAQRAAAERAAICVAACEGFADPTSLHVLVCATLELTDPMEDFGEEFVRNKLRRLALIVMGDARCEAT